MDNMQCHFSSFHGFATQAVRDTVSESFALAYGDCPVHNMKVRTVRRFTKAAKKFRKERHTIA